MMDFADFLDKLANVTIKQAASKDAQLVPGECVVCIGCGRYGVEDDANVLVLNDKATKQAFNREYDAKTELLIDPPAGLLAAWSLWDRRPLLPQQALDAMRLRLVDAAPDTVFAVILLLARLADVAMDDIPAVWTDAVINWKLEGNADDPKTSWCALESALAHIFFPIGKTPDEKELGAALTVCIRFAAQCMRKGLLPDRIPEMRDSAEWRRADVALRQEYEVYLDWLPHAAMVQLSLPVQRSDRRLLVDALLFVEDQQTGAARTIYRSDKEHSPLGHGFPFAAHYRPSEVGTGNDITISVDTRVGCQLTEVWQELERRETAAWLAAGEERPTDNPRPDVPTPYNQPWYISSNGTLVGAPRELKDGRPGSKLGWKDVRDAIWAVSNPLRDINVHEYPGVTEVPLLLLSPWRGDTPNATGSKKTVFLASWPGETKAQTSNAHRSLSSAPIVSRVLAALIHRGAEKSIPALADLPAEGSWDFVNLSGGFAVVSAGGVFVLDDWREQHLDMDAVKEALTQARRLDGDLRLMSGNNLRQLVDAVSKSTEGKKIGVAVTELLRTSAHLSAQISALRGKLAFLPEDADARVLWDAIDRRWELERRLNNLEQEVKSIEASLHTLSNLKTSRIGSFIAVFGFPVFFAGGLNAPASGAACELLKYGVNSSCSRWMPLVTYCALLFAMAGIIYFFFKLEGYFVRRNRLRAAGSKSRR